MAEDNNYFIFGPYRIDDLTPTEMDFLAKCTDKTSYTAFNDILNKNMEIRQKMEEFKQASENSFANMNSLQALYDSNKAEIEKFSKSLNQTELAKELADKKEEHKKAKAEHSNYQKGIQKQIKERASEMRKDKRKQLNEEKKKNRSAIVRKSRKIPTDTQVEDVVGSEEDITAVDSGTEEEAA